MLHYGLLIPIKNFFMCFEKIEHAGQNNLKILFRVVKTVFHFFLLFKGPENRCLRASNMKYEKIGTV